MYGYHKHFSSTCSEGFKSIQFTAIPENCAQFVQNIIWKLLLVDTVLRPRHQNDVPDHGFSWIFRKWMMFTRSQHPQNQKLCGKRSISTQKLPAKKIIFFRKSIFRKIFEIFRLLKNPKFRDFADPGMCPYL